MIRMKAMFTTRVVAAVIEPRLIDTAPDTVGCSSLPIVYTIDNPTDTMRASRRVDHR